MATIDQDMILISDSDNEEEIYEMIKISLLFQQQIQSL